MNNFFDTRTEPGQLFSEREFYHIILGIMVVADIILFSIVCIWVR